MVSEAAAVFHRGGRSPSNTLSLPEGQRKSEAAGLKAHQASEAKGGQIKPLTEIKIAFLFQKYFSWQWKLLKAATEKRWAVINDAIIADALVSVTVSGQQRPALSISSRVQKCTLTDMSRQRERKKENKY